MIDVTVHIHRADELELAAGLRRIETRCDNLEKLLMALTQKEQALVDAVNASTNATAAAITAAVTTIGDIVAKSAAGANDDELTADIQPSLDALKAAAANLQAVATQADPAVNPSAPPLPAVPVVTPVTGS